jgi:hypothetical protein
VIRWRYLNRGFANTKLQITQNLGSFSPVLNLPPDLPAAFFCLDLPAERGLA